MRARSFSFLLVFAACSGETKATKDASRPNEKGDAGLFLDATFEEGDASIGDPDVSIVGHDVFFADFGIPDVAAGPACVTGTSSIELFALEPSSGPRSSSGTATVARVNDGLTITIAGDPPVTARLVTNDVRLPSGIVSVDFSYDPFVFRRQATIVVRTYDRSRLLLVGWTLHGNDLPTEGGFGLEYREDSCWSTDQSNCIDYRTETLHLRVDGSDLAVGAGQSVTTDGWHIVNGTSYATIGEHRCTDIPRLGQFGFVEAIER
jgi:hypothetical protein